MVVAAIIAILITLLLPALARAKAMARQACCLGNLRQIGYFACNYSDDHSGFVMPADLGGSTDNWINHLAERGGGNPLLYQCPALRQEDMFNPYGGPNRIVKAAYVMNTIRRAEWTPAAMTTDPLRAHGWGEDTTMPVPISRVRCPEDNIFITDFIRNYLGSNAGARSSDARGIMKWNETDNGPFLAGSGSDARDVGDHHGGYFNALFGDGHALRAVTSVPEQWVVAAE